MNSIINAVATTAMTVIIGRQVPKKVCRTNISTIIVAIITFVVNFLICAVLGNHNSILDYYAYLQLSLVISQLVYYNLI